MKTLSTTNKITSTILKGLQITVVVMLILVTRSFAQKPLVENKVSNKLLSSKYNIAEVSNNHLEKDKVWNFEVKSYPNPYIDKLNFSYTAPEKGQARLQLFTLEGQRMAYVIIKRVRARTSATITYYIPSEQRVPLIYKFTLAGKTATGKMSPVENLSAR
jgi:hypothetical protein